MKHDPTFRSILTLAIGLAALGGHAWAADTAGANYVGFTAGSNTLQTQGLYQQGLQFVNVGFDNKARLDGVLGLTIGHAFALGLRPELEWSHRTNDVRKFGSRLYDGGGQIDGHGKESGDFLLANLWYDIDLTPWNIPLRPYLGAGLGRAKIKVKSLAAGGVPFGDADANVNAYQWGTGLAYQATPRLTLSLDYRRVITRSGHFGSIPNIPPGDVEARYKASSTGISLRVNF